MVQCAIHDVVSVQQGAYLPPAAIAKYSVHALDVIERCSEVFASHRGGLWDEQEGVFPV